jgi:hypothetical protein
MLDDLLPGRKFLGSLSLLERTMEKRTDSVILMLGLADVLEPLVFPCKGSRFSLTGIIRAFIFLFLQMCRPVVTIEVRVVPEWLLVWAPWCVAYKRIRMNVPKMMFVCPSRFEDCLRPASLPYASRVLNPSGQDCLGVLSQVVGEILWRWK